MVIWIHLTSVKLNFLISSKYSLFNFFKTDFKQEKIEFMETLGSGSFEKVIHAYNTKSNQYLAVKEFNDLTGEKNSDFMLEYVALKAIGHPNIVKIIGASQRKEQIHESRLFMEFASNGDLEKNEPFEWFIIHLFQISRYSMKYLHQRGIIHFDLKPKILIHEDGSAVVADFNTAMHVDINTYLISKRGTENYNKVISLD